MSVEITAAAMRKLAENIENDSDPSLFKAMKALRQAADALEDSQAKIRELTQGTTLPDGTYRPSKLEELESDREERDYFEARYAETRAALESSQAHARNLGEQLNATTADTEQAEARVAVLREALSAYGDESLRDPLTGLEAAAERLLAERKLLRSLRDQVNWFAAHPNGWTADTFEGTRDALTALHEFDDKETK